MVNSPNSNRRRRGVYLSAQGWQRLQAAEQLSAMRDNGGKAYTLEQLSTRTGLSPNTLTKARRRQRPVDFPTLETYFQAFNLVPQDDDYLADGEKPESSPGLVNLQQRPLKGQLSLDSPFYIYRQPAERLCAEEIFHPGALIRLRGPRQFGKTSLVARTLSRAQDHDFRTAVISLQSADRRLFTDLNQFMRWFCAMVARSLELPNQLDTRWDPLFGGNYSCSDYFENYLLAAAETPLLLVIDEADELFNYPEIAADFFGMLRAWYEQGRYGVKQRPEWSRLRLILIKSSAVWLPLSLHQSPFNVGLLVELPAFNQGQVEELAQRYGLSPASTYSEKLLALLGGNPYLTQMAMFYLSQEQLSLEDLHQSSLAPDGIFGSHLREVLSMVERYDLLSTMAALATQPDGVSLSPQVAQQLRGLGLIKFSHHRAVPQCQLYGQYFQQFYQAVG
jgi:transcriptional regulator with XRE-family HTH domain